jgi:hypothetical protein
MQAAGEFADIDTKTTSGARVYDYMLGGTDNYPIDRMTAELTEQMLPGTMAMARNSRRYMERLVRYLASDCGIRQFIDNGSGLPTRNNVHHVAQAIDPASRVIYLDKDPVVLRHQKVSALAENQNTAFVLADATQVEEILEHPETRRLLNPDEPAAALYLTFMHFVPDEADPGGIVARMMDHLAPGSYLAISQVVSDDPKVRQRMTDFAMNNTRGSFGRFRKKQEVRAFFNGLQVIEPGLGNVNDWHPDGREEEQSSLWVEYGGVARKPA